MQSHGITLSFHRKMTDSSRELVERYPRFIGSHLAEATRWNLRISYARFLRFISTNCPHLPELRPEARIDRVVVAEYVAWRRRSCGDAIIAVDLDNLRGAPTRKSAISPSSAAD
jgi:hypothetical protein